MNTQNPDPNLIEANAPTLKLTLDGKPPPPPSGVKVQPGGEALELSWDQLTGIPDFSGGGYLVFCARGGELPMFSPSFYNNQYTSCPTGGAAATVAGPDAGLEQAPIETAEP